MPEPFGPGRQRGRHLAKVCTARATGGGATGRSYVKTKRPRIGYVGDNDEKLTCESSKFFCGKDSELLTYLFSEGQTTSRSKVPRKISFFFLSYWRVPGIETNIHLHSLDIRTRAKPLQGSWQRSLEKTSSSNMLKKTSSGWKTLKKKTSHLNFHWRKKRAVAAKKRNYEFLEWTGARRRKLGITANFLFLLAKNVLLKHLPWKQSKQGPWLSSRIHKTLIHLWVYKG